MLVDKIPAASDENPFARDSTKKAYARLTQMPSQGRSGSMKTCSREDTDGSNVIQAGAVFKHNPGTPYCSSLVQHHQQSLVHEIRKQTIHEYRTHSSSKTNLQFLMVIQQFNHSSSLTLQYLPQFCIPLLLAFPAHVAETSTIQLMC